MAIVVINKAESVVGVFRRETVGIDLGDVESGENSVGGGRRDRAEWGVFVVRGDATCRLVGHKVGNALVAIVEVEKVVSS